ncbi:MAG: cellulase family glycosylhydrolase [Phycisphaerae bacterium]
MVDIRDNGAGSPGAACGWSIRQSGPIWVGILCSCAAAAGGEVGGPGSPAGGGQLPRIAVRDGRFVEKDSAKRFRPRGFNYIRLRPRWHGTFAPKRYDSARAEAMLADLHRNGFNTVRVFIDPAARDGIVESAAAEGFSRAYMGNFLDLLTRARRHGVYVVASLLALPACKPYNAIVGRDRRQFGHGNEMYLDERFVRAKGRFVSDFVAAVKRRDPGLLSTVLAYELDNETHFFADSGPFDEKQGTFKWNGKSYDRSSSEDLQRLADAAVIRWADACVDAAGKVDPDAMVSVNVFTFAAVGRKGPNALRESKATDRRFPARPLALARTKLSYIDIHFYPFRPDTLERDLASIEFDRLREACMAAGKPLIMGEFGSFKKNHKTLAEAAAAMKEHLARVRALGFEGFLYWTYDTDEQPYLWNAKSGKGEIFEVLREAARLGDWRQGT